MANLKEKYNKELRSVLMEELGIKNIMDEDPPSLGANVRPGYDNVMHNVLGRTVYMTLNHTF